MRAPLALLAFLFTGCATTRADRLDALFADLHRRGLFDGAVVVGVGEEVVFEKGYGFANREARVRFTPDTPADGGSLAKTMTAELVLDLAAAGKLSLDEPAQRLLPELPYPDITLRHLLSHSNGLPDYGWFDEILPRDSIRTTEALLAVLARQKPNLAFAPGTAFEYSSLGFDLALLAAARAAGTSYPSLLRTRIFEPLGLTSAFLRPARLRDFPGVRTRGYPEDVFDYEAFHGGSNIYISARDLHRWNASFFTRQLPRRNPPFALTLGSWYRAADDSAFWYSGHLQGFHDEVFREMATKTSIVYVSNNTIAPWLQKGIVRAVRAILRGEDVRPLQPPQVSADARTGTWDEWRIARNDEKLSLIVGDVAYPMVKISDEFFYVPGVDPVIGFRGGALYVSTNVEERWVTASTDTQPSLP